MNDQEKKKNIVLGGIIVVCAGVAASQFVDFSGHASAYGGNEETVVVQTPEPRAGNAEKPEPAPGDREIISRSALAIQGLYDSTYFTTMRDGRIAQAKLQIAQANSAIAQAKQAEAEAILKMKKVEDGEGPADSSRDPYAQSSSGYVGLSNIPVNAQDERTIGLSRAEKTIKDLEARLKNKVSRAENLKNVFLNMIRPDGVAILTTSVGIIELSKGETANDITATKVQKNYVEIMDIESKKKRTLRISRLNALLVDHEETDNEAAEEGNPDSGEYDPSMSDYTPPGA